MKEDFVIAKLDATPAHKRGSKETRSQEVSALLHNLPQPHSHRGARYTNTEAPPPPHDRTVPASNRQEAEGKSVLEPAETPTPDSARSPPPPPSLRNPLARSSRHRGAETPGLARSLRPARSSSAIRNSPK